ncbi:MAG: diguanylate cyclase [Clostridia bacterium]|nr:diguanylate cyclase [Clostridia bacterium]
MKQIQFTFEDDGFLNAQLRKLHQWCRNNLISATLIQIYTEHLDRERIRHVCERVRAVLPEALILGCSSNGNIVNGDFSGGSIALICTLFESPDARVEVLQYPLSTENQADVARQLREAVEMRGWVKAVGLLVTIRGMSMTALCEGLSELPQHIHVFGGGAFSEDIDAEDACVFIGGDSWPDKSVAFLLLGGEDFHIETSYVTGWKPLGSFMDVTSAEGSKLRELNNRPAYDTYYKYLHIRNDEHFFYNTLEFPFLYRHNGIDIMRAPVSSNPDGSLTMTSDVSQNVKVRIAYGDPWTILDSAWQEGNRLLKFAPECIMVFSCAARRTFWGNSEVGKETEPYQIVAPTSGFYTSGEFLRTGKFVNQHNVTQVIAAMREGEASPHREQEIAMTQQSFEGKVSMINRMATFIKATTQELEEANRKLSEIAVTDALTGLGNKTAYLERIRKIETLLEQPGYGFAVAVFDINGLKQINDHYGHECGDEAITQAAIALKQVFDRRDLYRIGGDEYIAILENASETELARRFSALDGAIAAINETEKSYHVPLAISKGAAFHVAGGEYRAAFRQADEAMYRDKAEYYKTHDRRRK